MKLVEVPNKTVPQYILVNALDIVEISYFDKSPEDYLLNGILIPVLAVIFMLKGEVKEGKVFPYFFVVVIYDIMCEIIMINLRMCVRYDLSLCVFYNNNGTLCYL